MFIYAQAMLKIEKYIYHTNNSWSYFISPEKNWDYFITQRKKLLLQLHTCKSLLDAKKPYLVTENSKEHLYIMTGNKLLCTQNSRITIKRIIYMPLHIGIIMSIHYSHNDEQSESY